MGKRWYYLIALFFLAESVSQSDIYLQGVGSDHARSFKHDRFYTGADRAFIGQPFNWSGVGQAGSGQWVTMISPSYFVSANHLHPSPGDNVTFYPGDNNTPGLGRMYTVDNVSYATLYDNLTSDLWLGRLTTPLSPQDNITSYPILELNSASDYNGLEIYVYGQPNRIGRNIIDDIYSLSLSGNKTQVLWYDFDATGGVGEDEAYLISGDSGGPSFIVCNNALALVGIHYVNTVGWPPAQGFLSGDSFVPFYIDQLNANMAGESVLALSGSVIREQVLLAGFVGDKTTVPVTFEIRNPDNITAVETRTINLSADGTYAFPTVLPQGLYDIAAKAPHWLRQKRGITIGDNTTVIHFTLINGDCDGDNEITSTDLSIVMGAMDSVANGTNYDSRADLDGDGKVTGTDLSIVLAGMDLMGDN